MLISVLQSSSTKFPLKTKSWNNAGSPFCRRSLMTPEDSSYPAKNDHLLTRCNLPSWLKLTASSKTCEAPHKPNFKGSTFRRCPAAVRPKNPPLFPALRLTFSARRKTMRKIGSQISRIPKSSPRSNFLMNPENSGQSQLSHLWMKAKSQVLDISKLKKNLNARGRKRGARRSKSRMLLREIDRSQGERGNKWGSGVHMIRVWPARRLLWGLRKRNQKDLTKLKIHELLSMTHFFTNSKNQKLAKRNPLN